MDKTDSEGQMNLTRRSFLKLTGAALLAPVLLSSLTNAEAAIAKQLVPQEEGPIKSYLNPQFDINAIICVLYEIHNSYEGYTNDVMTRGQLHYQAEDYLRHLQYNRSLYEFVVTCNESNNSPSIIDDNDLVLDVALKAMPVYGEFHLRFSFTGDKTDPRDIVDEPLRLEDAIFVTNNLEAGERKAAEAKFVIVYVLDKSATEEDCRTLHTIMCDFWKERDYDATLFPYISSEPVVGRQAMLRNKLLEKVPANVFHLSPFMRDRVHDASLNTIHFYPSMGLFVRGNYAWSQGTPLYGITVDSLRSRGISFSGVDNGNLSNT
jgi:hypothetical protein